MAIEKATSTACWPVWPVGSVSHDDRRASEGRNRRAGGKGCWPDRSSWRVSASLGAVLQALPGIRMLVTGLVLALLAGAFVKLKVFGGGQ
jgi:hypothetical protein